MRTRSELNKALDETDTRFGANYILLEVLLDIRNMILQDRLGTDPAKEWNK